MTYCFCDSSATCPPAYIFCPEMALPPPHQHGHGAPHGPRAADGPTAGAVSREADGPIDGSVHRSEAGTIDEP